MTTQELIELLQQKSDASMGLADWLKSQKNYESAAMYEGSAGAYKQCKKLVEELNEPISD